MKYHEIFERDDSKIIANLKALIAHPNTEPNVKAVAQRKLDAILGKQGEEPAKPTSSGFQPMTYGSDGKLKAGTPEPSRFKAGFTPRSF
jgi:hypothetical protein